MEKEIIFVYNANSGLFSQITDYAHKLISPNTYKCNLCKLTFGATMRPDWKEYLNTLPYQVTFLHKDELIEQYPNLAATNLPVIFEKTGDQMRILVNNKEIQAPTTLADLIELVKSKIDQMS